MVLDGYLIFEYLEPQGLRSRDPYDRTWDTLCLQKLPYQPSYLYCRFLERQ